MLVRAAVVFASALLATGGALGGCARATAPYRPWIAMIVGTGGLSDRSLNAAAYAALRECGRQTRARITAQAVRSAADLEPDLRVLAIQQPATIVTVGAQFAPALESMARRFGTVQFASVGAAVDQPNVQSIVFKVQDGAFLAGALAALVSRTKHVGFLGATQSALVEPYEAGFAAGARQIDPRVGVARRYVGSFGDAARAKALANALFAEGNDVVFVVAGPGGHGAIDAVKARQNAYVIGVDVDQDSLAPGRVLTSVVRGVGPAVLQACRDAVAQKPQSGLSVMGLADGGIALTSFPYTRSAIGAAHLARLQRVRRALVAGVVTAPATRSALAAFHPVALRGAGRSQESRQAVRSSRSDDRAGGSDPR